MSDLWVEGLRWTAAGCTMVASVMVAWGASARMVAWGFVIFTAASLTWITASVIQGLPALLIQNILLLCVNLFGVYRWWGRET
ncbi:MAG: hypothetical protein ACU0DW_14935 [Shimia sp.]